MKEGKLTNSDVTRNFIALDKSVHGLFKPFIGSPVTIRDQNDCEFKIEVTSYKTISNNGKITERLFLTRTKDFIHCLDLKEGDEIHFCRDVRDGKRGSFVVEIKENDTCSNVPSIDKQKKDELIEVISKTYESVVNEYKNIFNENRYLPTKASQNSINGFTERNLTFNFCHSYLTLNSAAIVWQEIPINSLKKQHIDSIIIDKEKDLVIYLEAKRLYDIPHFKYLMDDLKRIKKQHSNIPLPLNPPSKKVAILLADQVYDGKKDEKDFYDKYFTGQKDIDLPKINEKKHSYLAKKLPNMIKSAKISAVCETQALTIRGEYNNNISNISIEKDILYTIYCGVYFIE